MTTFEEFQAMTGRSPIQDDLDRVNCEEVGTIGHCACGICQTHQKPRFLCGCRVWPANVVAFHDRVGRG